jgi:DNA-binding MarR family transcriptional regulator
LKQLWEQEGRTHSELAAALHVQPATITNMLRRMEEAGLVERRPDAHDHRVSRVYLTAVGREVESKVRAALSRLDDEVMRGFSPEERADLDGYLLRMRNNLWTAQEGADS